MRAEPVRTCVGCRTRTTTDKLLRTVLVGDVVRPDPARRLPGRGASLHPDPACLDLAVRRRAFIRAFRVRTAPDVTAIRDYLRAGATAHDGRRTRGGRIEKGPTHMSQQ